MPTMKIKNLYIIIFILFCINGQSQTNLVELLDKITIEHIKTHVDTLASESMEGRYTGAPGQKLAARYIANEFCKYGLTPVDTNAKNEYYQKFELYKYQTGVAEIFYNNLFYWAPIYLGNNSISDSIYDPIIFAGYADQENLKNLEIDNKSIFFLSESVKEAIEKAKNLSSTYSVNTIVVGLPLGKKLDKSIFYDTINDLTSFKELFYYYNFYLTNHRNNKDFGKLLSMNRLIPNALIESDKDIKILFVPEELSEAIFQKNFEDLKKISSIEKKSKKNNLAKIKPAEFSYMVNYNPTIDTIKTENVIGYIDSELSDQKIIIGGHYDHIGRNHNNEINYGADDNASGTTAILTIAELLSNATKDGVTLNKDIVFIAHSGEEIGLHGSEYYTENPLFPLTNTEVLFNVDMIGRDKDDDPAFSNTVFLLEWEGGSEYIKNIETLNKEYTNLIVNTKPDPKDKTLWTYGSDHYSFVKKGVSSVAYFTALHRDYHTPGDTPDKLNYDKMNRIIQLIFLNIWDIAIIEN